MSSIGIHGPRPIIGAHADHRTSDFFFPRMQSLETRDTPWERRIRPLIPWHQYAAYATALVLAGAIGMYLI